MLYGMMKRFKPLWFRVIRLLLAQEQGVCASLTGSAKELRRSSGVRQHSYSVQVKGHVRSGARLDLFARC